mgnify:CR=1 FL=1
MHGVAAFPRTQGGRLCTVRESRPATLRKQKAVGERHAQARRGASQRQPTSQRGVRHAAWETDSEEEEEDPPVHPSISNASSGRVMAALATQLEQLEVGVGDVAAVVAGESDDGDEYWLLQVTQPPRQLAAPLTVGGLQFEAGEFVVEGTWHERCRGRGAGPRDYVLGEAAAAYTHLVICTDVELHQSPTTASSSSSGSLYTVSLHEDERICAARRALPMHLLDA